jgi:ferritin-like metal-binding protein YciE
MRRGTSRKPLRTYEGKTYSSYVLVESVLTLIFAARATCPGEAGFMRVWVLYSLCRVAFPPLDRGLLPRIRMAEAKFETLFTKELQDLYNAEKQIVEALPKMIAAASVEDLATALADHLEQTKEQVRRLERVFESIGEQPGNTACEGMRGLIQEGEKVIGEMEKSPVLDAALIAAAQKVEHYEISGYATARAMADMLGQSDAADLLDETLEEEKDADETLTEIAESIMTGDTSGEEEEEEEIEEEEIEEEQWNSARKPLVPPFAGQ